MTVALLVVALVAMLARPRGLASWVGPAVMAVVGLATTIIPWSVTGEALDLLTAPLAFLVFAVPLAVLLDRLGLFAALAASFDAGAHLVAWLWLLAAAVTALLNLDAAVVLLTPLYLQIARRHGASAEALAFQPALLACLASGLLPVSNLTNLIAAEHTGFGVGDFLEHMALPTVAACVVGWFCYRRAFDLTPGPSGHDDPVDVAALRQGLPIVAFVVAGFTLGDVAGVPAWLVAAIAAVWAAGLTRHVPWRTVPVDAMVIATSLSILVLGAADDLRVTTLLDAGGTGGHVRALGFGAIGSVATNNLPTVIAALPVLHDDSQVWPLLIGANIAPTLIVTGSLSGLLWRDTARRLGLEVSGRRYSAIGLRVGLPALVVAGAIVLALP